MEIGTCTPWTVARRVDCDRVLGAQIICPTASYYDAKGGSEGVDANNIIKVSKEKASWL